MGGDRWINVTDKKGRGRLLNAKRVVEVRAKSRGCEVIYLRGESVFAWENKIELTDNFDTFKSALSGPIEGNDSNV